MFTLYPRHNTKMNKYYFCFFIITISMFRLVKFELVFNSFRSHIYSLPQPSILPLRLNWQLSRLYKIYIMTFIKTQTMIKSQTTLQKLENMSKSACPATVHVILTHIVKKKQYG